MNSGAKPTPPPAAQATEIGADRAALLLELAAKNEELQQARANFDALLGHYADLYEFAPAGSLVLDRAGTIRQANLGAEKLLAVKRARLVARPLGEFVGEADRAVLAAFLDRVFSGAGAESCELALAVDHRPPTDVQAQGWVALGGSECRVILRDITAQEQADRLQADRVALLASVNANLAGTCLYRMAYHADGRMEAAYVSPNVERLVGVSVAQFQRDARCIFELVHPDDRAAFRAALAEGLRTGGEADIAVRVHPVAGGERWMQFRSHLVGRRPDGAQVRDGVVVDVTATKVIEQELRAVRDRLDMALRAAGCSTWHADVAAGTVTLDAAWAELLGQPARETVTTARALLALVHPADRSVRHAASRRAILGETDDYYGEHRVRTVAGVWIWVLSQGRVTARDPTGRATRLVGTNTDITARKAAEIEVRTMNTRLEHLVLERSAGLARSERQLRLVWESSLEGMRLTDAGGLVHRVNAAYCRLVGQPREALVGRPMSAPYAEAGRAGILAGHNRRFRERAFSERHEATVSLAAGTLRHLELANAFVSLPGEPELLLTVMRDVTGRKRAEQALRSSEARFRALVEHSGDTVLLLDAAGRIREANAAAARMHGYTHGELIGMDVRELDAPDAAQLAPERLRRLVAGETITFELEHRRKDGSVFPLEVVATPVAIDGETFVLASERDITERRRAEAALRQSETQLLIASHAARIGYWEYCVAADEFQFNDPFYSILRTTAAREGGYTMSSARYAARFVDPADAAVVGAEIGRALASPDPDYARQLDHRVRFGDGSAGHIAVHIRVVKDASGRTVRTRGAIVDITERKAAELSLARAHAQASTLAQVGRELAEAPAPKAAALAILGAARQLLGWDCCWLRVRHEGTGDWTGLVAFDLIDGETREVEIDPPAMTLPPTALRAALDDGPQLVLRESATDDVQRLRPFGSGRPSLSLMFVALHNAGRLVGLMSIQSYRPHAYDQAALALFQTLADHCAGALSRIHARAALGEIEARFHLVWDRTADGMRLADAEGRVAAVNDAYCAMMGRPRGEIEGQSLAVVYAAAERERILGRHCERFAAREVPVHLERRMTLHDGRQRWIDVTNCFIESDPARPLLLGIFRDITARKRAEAEREATQAHLRQRQKLEAIGTLAGGIAHDFNNILTGVLNYTELARADCPPTHPQVAGYLGEVLKCGQRATHLVRQILLFSRAEAVERTPVRLQQVAAETLALVRATIPTAVRIEADLDRNAPAIFANSTQIQQALMNLCINAAHAMSEGGGRLAVVLQPVQVDAALARELPDLRAGTHVGLTVSDTGTGIPPEHLERIFEPFFTTKKVGEGTGLGLAVVQSVVRSHEGALRVRSQPGAGTTFQLYFPVPAFAAEVARAEFSPPARGRGQRLLLVDDEPAIAKSGQMILERLGYRVAVFTNASTALAHFWMAPEAVDALVTDLQMPEMTGRELARKILARRPGLPVFIVSGVAGAANADELRREGVTAILDKPVDFAKAAAALARAFG